MKIVYFFSQNFDGEEKRESGRNLKKYESTHINLHKQMPERN